MANPVTVAHVEARFRSLSDAEQVNAEAWIDDVWSTLLERRPTLDDDLTDELITENAVIRTVTTAVIRKLQNPDGKLEEAGDDYRFRRDSATSTGSLYVSEDEILAVTPASQGRTHHSVRLVAYGES